MSRIYWDVIAAVALILLSFLTSAWANATSRLTKGRARNLEDDQPKKGKLLTRIAEDPAPYVTSVLFLMLIFRVAAVVLVAALLMRSDVPWPEVIAILVMSFVIFQVAEIAPRTWVIERLDQVLLLSARPVYWIGTAFRPVAVVLVNLSRLFLLILPGRGLPRGPFTSEEEIKSILDVAESEEVIEAGERELIHSIFDFGDTVVREVMVPRADMVCVDDQASLEEVLEIALKKGFSRIPVIVDGNIDDLAGIVYTKDLVRRLHNNGGKSKQRKAREIVREALFVPESKRVAELLREMQRTKTHMVIVVDEYGGTAGLVTLEDLLEEIVGEIEDEYDREDPTVVQMEDGSYRVSARLSIDELNELLGVEFPDGDWDSVGGLIAAELGKVADEGDRVLVEGVTFAVERVKGRRIQKVLVTPPRSRKSAVR